MGESASTVYAPPALVLPLTDRSHRFVVEVSPSVIVTVTDDGLPTVTPNDCAFCSATVNVSSAVSQSSCASMVRLPVVSPAAMRMLEILL